MHEQHDALIQRRVDSCSPFLIGGLHLTHIVHAFCDGPLLKVCTAAGSGCGSREGEGTQGARGGC